MRGASVLPLTERMLERLPSFYTGDSFIEGFQDALGREVQRIWDRVAAIQADLLLEDSADDTYGLLSLWEMLLGLPVAPPGVTVQARRDQVRSTLRARSQGSGSGWIAAVNYALGGTPWTYQEGPAAYTVTLYVSMSSSAFSSVQIETLLRKITPAHIDIAVEYSQGFVVGEGLVGEDRL